jgi:hypothetical protein
MPPAGFETVIPGSERSQSHVLDGAATEIDIRYAIYGVFRTEVLAVATRRSQPWNVTWCILVHKHQTAAQQREDELVVRSDIVMTTVNPL